MHFIEQSIQAFLEDIDNKSADQFEDLINEFGENCKKALRECLLAKRSEEPFRLRMSNLGKPLRQLMLEKLHGRGPMDAQMKLKMTYGYIWESFMLFLLKAAGLELEEQKNVSLDIPLGDEKVSVKGTWDIKINGMLYDIKSASSWSFDYKFTNFENMEKDDPFGYCGQAFGYSIAEKVPFGGWIVCDKSDGRIKVVPIPQDNYRDLAKKYYADFKTKVAALFTDNVPMPPCDGEVDETFRKVKTGNKVLNDSCKFCSHKYLCHPELKYKEAVKSEAQNKPWKYYTQLLNE
jgi:hypothetical protein